MGIRQSGIDLDHPRTGSQLGAFLRHYLAVSDPPGLKAGHLDSPPRQQPVHLLWARPAQQLSANVCSFPATAGASGKPFFSPLALSPDKQVNSHGLTWSSGNWRPGFLLLFLCTLAGSAVGLPIRAKSLILLLPGEFACWWGELGPSPEIAITQRELLCPRLCLYPRVSCLQ